MQTFNVFINIILYSKQHRWKLGWGHLVLSVHCHSVLEDFELALSLKILFLLSFDCPFEEWQRNMPKPAGDEFLCPTACGLPLLAAPWSHQKLSLGGLFLEVVVVWGIILSTWLGPCEWAMSAEWAGKDLQCLFWKVWAEANKSLFLQWLFEYSCLD